MPADNLQPDGNQTDPGMVARLASACSAGLARAAAHPSYVVASVTGFLGIAVAVWILLDRRDSTANSSAEKPAGSSAKRDAASQRPLRDELLSMRQFELDEAGDEADGAIQPAAHAAASRPRDESIFAPTSASRDERGTPVAESNQPSPPRRRPLFDDDGAVEDEQDPESHANLTSGGRGGTASRTQPVFLPLDDADQQDQPAEVFAEEPPARQAKPLAATGKTLNQPPLADDQADLPSADEAPPPPARVTAGLSRPKSPREEIPADQELDLDEEPGNEPPPLTLPRRNERSMTHWKGAEGKPLPAGAAEHSSQASALAETVILPVEGRRTEAARSAAATTRVAPPAGDSVTVQVTGPESCRSGERLEYRVAITNTGKAAVRNLLLWVDLPNGLEHPQGPQIEYEVAALLGGQTHRVPLRLKAKSPGPAQIEVRALLGRKTAASSQLQVEIHSNAKGPTARRD